LDYSIRKRVLPSIRSHHRRGCEGVLDQQTTLPVSLAWKYRSAPMAFAVALEWVTFVTLNT
jgi:hypothetical protein